MVITDIEYIYAYEVVDINNDGIKELIITYNANGGGKIGEADFNTHNSATIYSTHLAGDTYTTEFRNGLISSDVNKDNMPDLIGANGSSSLNVYLKNNGDWKLLPDYTIGSDGYAFEIGDYNHDTYADAMSSSSNTNILSFTPGYSEWPKSYSFGERNSTWQEWINVDEDEDEEVFVTYRRRYSDHTEHATFDYDAASDSFTPINLNLGIDFSNVETFTFYDYDQDGDKDLLTLPPVGHEGYTLETHLYVNDGSFNFSFYKSFPSANRAIWHDMDNDGWADLILESSPPKENPTFTILYVTKVIFQRGKNEFVESDLESVSYDWRSEMELSDYDDDGDTDIFFHYEKKSYSKGLRVCVNNWANLGNNTTPPTVPQNLSSQDPNALKHELSWDPSTDDKSGQYGIYYNVVIKKGDEHILSPSADVSTGYQFKSFTSNAGSNTTIPINCLPDGTYQWAVQAIDNSGKASEFSEFSELIVTGRNPSAPSNLKAETISDEIISLSWEPVSDNETEYILERKFAHNDRFYFATAVPANQTSYLDTLHNGASTKIQYRVKAANCAWQSEYSQPVDAETFPLHFQKSSKFILAEAQGRAGDFGDYNNDGYLDLLVNYRDEITGSNKVELYKNDHGQFLPSGISFENKLLSQLVWVDYNTDGLLDIFMVSEEFWNKTIELHINKGNNEFEKILLDSLIDGYEYIDNLYWVDLDNNQRPELVFSANSRILLVVTIHPNKSFDTEQIMMDVKLVAPPVDLNSDGFLDFPILNTSMTENNLGYLMNSGNKTFEYISMNSGLFDFDETVVFAPLNEDSYLDAVLMGPYYQQGQYGQSIILSNFEGVFQERSNTNLLLAKQQGDVSIAYGDFYHDGSTDLITMGYFDLTPTQSHDGTVLYHNVGNYQYEFKLGLFESETQYGKVIAGDIDNDGDLDLIHMGEKDYTSPRIVLFENTIADGWGEINDRPEPPKALSQQVDGNKVTLNWDSGADDLTSVNQLSYNVTLIKDDTDTVIFPMSHRNGRRKLVGFGNAQLNHHMIIDSLKDGTYKWSVQSIDGGFQGSEFTDLQEFTIEISDPNPDESEVLQSSLKVPLVVFPSPAKDVINITTGNQPFDEIIIQGLLGRKVLISKGHCTANCTKQLNIENLPKGLYLINLKNNSQQTVLSGKFIKN
ncbi:MAG: FG-GAP-like repeat-containing protein [Marinoscillum sp.]